MREDDYGEHLCVNADSSCPAYRGVSSRAAEVRRPAGVCHPCALVASFPLTTGYDDHVNTATTELSVGELDVAMWRCCVMCWHMTGGVDRSS